jgi:hypothetical protein
MIYRFMASFLLGSAGFLFLCGSALAYNMEKLGPAGKSSDSFWTSSIAKLFGGKAFAAFQISTLALALFLLWPGIVEYLTTYRCTLHWSRVMVGTFLLLAAVQAAVTAAIIRLVAIWRRDGRPVRRHGADKPAAVRAMAASA